MIVAHHFQVTAVDILNNLTADFTGGMDFDKAIDADDPVNQLGDKAEIVGDGDHRNFGGQLVEDFQKLVFYGRIDIGGWFVKQQQFGFAGQGPGNENPLALAAGEGAKGAFGQISHPHLVQGIAGDLFVFFTVGAKAVAAQPAHEGDIKDAYRKTLVILEILRHVADLSPGPLRLSAQDGDCAATWGQEAQGEFDKGGLAAAIGAHHTDGFVALGAKRGVAEDLVAVKGKGDVVEGENGLGHDMPRLVKVEEGATDKVLKSVVS